MSKILYFHHYNDFSGSTKVLSDYISSLNDNKGDIVILTDSSKRGFLSDIDATLINVPIIRYHGRAIPVISQFLWFFIGLFKAFRYGQNYDTFYINTLIPMYAAIVGVVLNKKIIYHIHEKYITHSLKSRAAEYIFNHVKAERKFVSKYVADKYKPLAGCTSSINYNKLGRSFVNKVKIVPFEEHRLNEVIMISSLQKGKGVDNYLRLAEKMSDLHFTLIVSASQERILSYFSTAIPSNLDIYPAQSNIHPFLQKADVILNMSIPSMCVETFGMTIIEGMAYGLPAIVPNAGGPVELVDNGFNGFSVDVTDIDIVAKYLREILISDNYLVFRNNALKRVQKYIY